MMSERPCCMKELSSQDMAGKRWYCGCGRARRPRLQMASRLAYPEPSRMRSPAAGCAAAGLWIR